MLAASSARYTGALPTIVRFAADAVPPDSAAGGALILVLLGLATAITMICAQLRRRFLRPGVMPLLVHPAHPRNRRMDQTGVCRKGGILLKLLAACCPPCMAQILGKSALPSG